MKKLLVGIAALVLAAQTAWATCYGPAACGPASQYKVKVYEVAICSDAACTSRQLVGSAASEFDIASAAAGSVIGSYARVDSIPAGVYTHLRVVVGRSFTISGPPINGGGANICPAVNGLTLYIPNNNPGLDAALGGWNISWNDSPAKTQLAVTRPLSSAIAISNAGKRPTVSVKFNTQEGLMCMGGVSLPAPPDVNITSVIR